MNSVNVDPALRPENFTFKSLIYESTNISDLNSGDKFKEISGTIAKLYLVFFYDWCPTCLRKMDAAQKGFCKHSKQEVVSTKVAILDLGIDDSTGYIRTSFFKDKAEKILGVGADQVHDGIKNYLEKGFNFKNAGEAYLSDNHFGLLGKEIVVSGNVAESEYVGNVFQAHNIYEIDLEEEIEKVIELIGREIQ